ncbi:MAG TPA: hypothetical protein VF690_19310 [Hymenobacter sp.]|jgi:hypothetical protein
MSLFYSIAFPQSAPEPEPLVQQLAGEWGPTVTIVKEEQDEQLVLQDDEWLLSLRVNKRPDYYELSFGEYHYQSKWFLGYGKKDPMESLRFCLELLNKLIRSFPDDFLALFNGELVLLKREAGQLYLNRESGVWEQPAHVAIFQDLEHSFVTYPIN